MQLLIINVWKLRSQMKQWWFFYQSWEATPAIIWALEDFSALWQYQLFKNQEQYYMDGYKFWLNQYCVVLNQYKANALIAQKYIECYWLLFPS